MANGDGPRSRARGNLELAAQYTDCWFTNASQQLKDWRRLLLQTLSPRGLPVRDSIAGSLALAVNAWEPLLKCHKPPSPQADTNARGQGPTATRREGSPRSAAPLPDIFFDVRSEGARPYQVHVSEQFQTPAVKHWRDGELPVLLGPGQVSITAKHVVVRTLPPNIVQITLVDLGAVLPRDQNGDPRPLPEGDYTGKIHGIDLTARCLHGDTAWWIAEEIERSRVLG